MNPKILKEVLSWIIELNGVLLCPAECSLNENLKS